ncbi:hypothetical protein B0H16DRAFT_651637 [Mycena metata]|uniref:F-box domain-containing protein n=1 Tax=Mycena metata TaxID=1033252 RepID=A0AAD7MBB1_9AGAR|nr:hypothetical protein B0H16DRAFT_651637 [Mycena metata]
MVLQAGTESRYRQPTQSERNSLAADRAHIAVIDAKIMGLKRSLSLLRKERGLLQDRLDAYTYPVLTLPNEIVSEIFVHFLPVYPETPSLIGSSSPNLLGQICRKWREIVLSTPALWRGISLSLSNGKHIDQKLRLLQLWLQRSGSCLLSIRMDLQIDPDDIDDDMYLSDPNLAASLDLFTHAIVAHSGRWEYLRLYLPDVHPFPSIGTPLPFLRELTMDSMNDSDSIAEALHAAPLLQTVAVQFWHERCISVYPWTQLTTFFEYGLLAHECVDILTQAINLVKCNVEFDWAEDEVSQPPRNVTHPCLSSLILRGTIPDEMSWKLLDIFTLPALRKLEIVERLLQDDPIGLLKLLISRSKCHMRELYMPDLDRRSLETYRLALPAVGSIARDKLDRVNPWLVLDDSEMTDYDSDSDSD